MNKDKTSDSIKNLIYLRINRNIILILTCADCHGKGWLSFGDEWIKSFKHEWIKCKTCDGEGTIKL